MAIKRIAHESVEKTGVQRAKSAWILLMAGFRELVARGWHWLPTASTRRLLCSCVSIAPLFKAGILSFGCSSQPGGRRR